MKSAYWESTHLPRRASGRMAAGVAACLLVFVVSAANAGSRGTDDAALLRAVEKDLQAGRVESAIALGDSAVKARRDGGDLPGARRLREQEIAVLHRTGVADTLVAAADYNLGKICYDQHDYAAAEAAWRQALPLFASASPPDHRGTVWCLNDIADTRRIAGDFTAAESLLVRAVAISEAHLPRNSGHARLLNNLGALYRDLDRLDDAERLYREALRISEADPEAKPKRIAISYLNLGVLTCDQGRLEEAEKLLLHALELGRKSVQTPDPAGFVYFLSEPATLYARLGRWDESIRLREEALSILSGLEVPHEIYHARILYDTAEALLARGDSTRAETLLREALAKRERVLGASHPDVGATLTALAEVVGARSAAGSREMSADLARALEIFDKSNAQPEVEAEARALQAQLEHAAGKRSAALTEMERALTLVEALRPRRGGGDESRIRFLQKFAGYYNEMIAWQVEAGRPEAALDYAERIRARVLHEQLVAGQANLRRDIPAEVLAPLERREQEAKLRLAGIQQEITWARANWTPSDRDGIARLASLEKQQDAALRDYRAVTEEIQLQSPAWRRLLHRQEQKVSVSRIQEKLVQPDEVLLLYQIGPESSFLFVVPPAPQPLECHPLRIPADVASGLGVEPGALRSDVLTALVAGRSAAERERSVMGGIVRLRKVTGVALVDGGTKSLDAAPVDGESAVHVDREPGAAERRAEQSYRLWKVLLPDLVWERVRSAAQVVIVPDGSLHQLPFEALVVQQKPGDIRYWLDIGPAIRYANSITTLLDVAGRSRGKGGPARVLTVSDPIFDPQEVAAQMRAAGREVAMSTRPAAEPGDVVLRQGAGLPRLPATARESAAIQQAFGTERVVCLRGLDATETRVKAAVAGARYIHIATHGIVDESHEDLLAGLMLTSPPAGERAPADDGCLHLFEIYELPLQCELAVLSACETESGRSIQGEGVFALSRGFLVAGAQRTVASLWPVADESTALLVADFFRRVAAAGSTGVIDYAAFLRDAKRKLRADSRWSDPFFWAPFVMSGIR